MTPSRRHHARPPRPPGRWRRLLLGCAAGAGALALVAGVVAVVDAVREPSVQRIAYFADWNTANRGYRIKDVADSGAADRLTRLMWAFGEISPEGRCHIPVAGSRAWEVYQRRYSAEDSVDGRADTYEQPLAGGLNQLRKLRESHPSLGASISLGGWNTSTHFSTAARTEESRREFVRSCVDLWLRGDLPVADGEPQGGAGAAAGVFDGVDLDWEWPGGDGHPDNTEHPADRRNFTLLVAEFRRQLDALAEETGREYTLSVSLAGDEERMRESYEPEAFGPVDFATVQGYDLTGPWSQTTGHHSQLYTPRGAPEEESVDSVVRAYLDHGLPAEKLVVGFPGFGRGWQGVETGADASFGRFAPAPEPAEGDYGEGAASYADLERRSGRRFHDESSGSQWLVSGDEWWSYDTPEVVAQKAEYVRQHDLGGLMLWNLDMDPDGELVRAMDDHLGW
ncbi:chitinase [Streptomonospora nanhaiensis]|uniref:chitinase n=1 Tax=Streptomonospora nanhaiensis TaxID=1323731 RepID=A0A853BIV8_9ACTN|nr:chitinase [Streptomonospora nanhaiensis]